MALAAQDDLTGMIALCRREALLPEHLDDGQVRRTVALYEATARAADSYRAPVAGLPVTFFAAARGEGEDVSLGWRDLLGPTLDIVRIGGSHLSIVRPPLLDRLAREIAGRIGNLSAPVARPAANQ